jgi:hypothetical protein
MVIAGWVMVFTPVAAAFVLLFIPPVVMTSGMDRKVFLG